MRMDDYPEADGQRVWLEQPEVSLLVSHMQGTEQEIAAILGAKAGLRREEITSVTLNDFAHAPSGFLRVWGDYAKRDQYRETPIPTGLADRVAGYIEGRERAPDEPVVSVEPGSVYRWVRRAAERCQAKTGDRGWSYLKPHDLRRTWGGHLLWNCGVLPFVVMSWGGWRDWSTFRDHYMGEMSPEAAERERRKLFDAAAREAPLFEPTVDLGEQPRGSVYG